MPTAWWPDSGTEVFFSAWCICFAAAFDQTICFPRKALQNPNLALFLAASLKIGFAILDLNRFSWFCSSFRLVQSYSLSVSEDWFSDIQCSMLLQLFWLSRAFWASPPGKLLTVLFTLGFVNCTWFALKSRVIVTAAFSQRTPGTFWCSSWSDVDKSVESEWIHRKVSATL